MEKWDNQTAFTTAARGMLEQGKRSEVGGSCTYRSTDSKGNVLCCGVGFLVSKELAKIMDNVEGESTNIDFLIQTVEEVADVFSEVCPSLLQEIQEIHDVSDPYDWEDCLKELAVSYELEWEL